ncbi:hypothetical protein [Paenibacillus sp. FSL R5-0908]|uniref:hypothetical protein n=1 Tax=Paenibacillus sp. FSL R5-0908 TaxID=2921664 RepID=UPI0030FA1773
MLRLQLQDARDRLDEIHRTLSNLDKLTSIKQPLQRFPAVGTPIPVQADYANRLITLGELTGASMADLMDQARDLVRDYRLGDSFALAAVEAMHGFTWSEGRYVPYEQ